MVCREYAQKMLKSSPPHHSVTVTIDVPNRAPIYDEGPPGIDWERWHGKFYADPEDEGKTLNYSIINITDQQTLASGSFTPNQSNQWHLQLTNPCETLRGKTVEFKLWNPNQNGTKPLAVHGIVTGGPG